MRLLKFLLTCIVLINMQASANNSDCDSSNNCNSSSDCQATQCFNNVRTIAHFRSQGARVDRELVGWQWELNKAEMCENYGAAYLAFEYQRSFKDKKLAEAILGTSRLSFAGSAVTDRAANELLADNFGLPQDFRGSICFSPRMENYIVDFGFYLGLDYWVQGLYVRFHVPFVHARWQLDTNCGNAVTIESGTTTQSGAPKTFPACYMGQEVVDTAASIRQALSGNFLFDDMQEPWCAGKFDFARRTKNGLADIDVILGYNFINDDCYHFGLYAQAVLPTGNRPNSHFVFNPVVGNYKHFELGGGISAHTVLWSNEDANLALFLEGNVTHMFRSRQCRLFDLCNNGPFSRYLLLKEFDTNGTTFTYNGRLLSATCFTNREVDVSLDVKGDFALKLAYRWCGLGLDVGYNIYGHSRERVELPCDSCPGFIDRRKFAVKGTEGVCCTNYDIAIPTDSTVKTIFPQDTPFNGATAPAGCPPLSGTVSQTSNMPNNAAQPGATAFEPGISQSGTIADTDCSVCLNAGTVTQPTAINQLTTENGFLINNGLQPVLLSVNDIDLHSGEAHSLITHGLFMHLNYTWLDECGWNPQLGVGGHVEFVGNHHRSGCEVAGAYLWSVWLKGGLSF